MEQTIVDVTDLSRSFGPKRAIDDVTFRAMAGQVHGLVGANGAGKTTLIKHLLGLLNAATGSVRVFGFDPVREPVRVLGRVGYLSEERELPEWMRIDGLMAYTQAFHPTWDAAYAGELIETFGLDPSKKVKQLSKGMRAQAGLVAVYLAGDAALDTGSRIRVGQIAPADPLLDEWDIVVLTADFAAVLAAREVDPDNHAEGSYEFVLTHDRELATAAALTLINRLPSAGI